MFAFCDLTLKVSNALVFCLNLLCVRAFEISGYLYGSMLFKKHLNKQNRLIYKLMSVLKQTFVHKSKPVFQVLNNFILLP